MLDELAVRNLAILEEARIQPGPGLTVLSGETGTGKTLLLGALGILNGADFPAERIGPFSEEASIEARFTPRDGAELILCRKRERGGRTRSYLNGDMAAVGQLTDQLTGRLEIVAQHDHLRIIRKGAVLAILDEMLDDQGRMTRDAYREAWEEWTLLNRRAIELGGDRRGLERERDLLVHEAREIATAAFGEGEVEELRAGAARLRHARELLELLGTAVTSLDVAGDAIGRSVTMTRRAAELSSDLAGLATRVNGMSIDLGDVAREARDELEATTPDPGELERVEERLATLGELRRRYGDTVAEINAHGERATLRAAELASTLDLADRIGGEMEKLRSRLGEVGSALTAARRVTAEELTTSAMVHLRDLGFASPQVVVEFTDLPGPAGEGTAGAVLLFTSEESLPPGPISRVASGGELSRLVLALRLAAGIGDVDVVAFDEVDAGVGGATALRVGEKLAELANRLQVVCVTHLPQIAAFADTHYTIERLDGRARARRVEGQARLTELTRMLSGIESTDSGLSHAEELVEYANHRRT